ncbi:TPA: phosphoribosyl-AMP cyclohydrolase [Candidatus Poribacteria bacterium]|nr:phosphoribosyl-AMP cyclohydrolase [Candidatus Poribacteria bacterium]
MEFIKELKFDSNGLIPAIIQEYQNGDVLMLGYMNEEALRRTLQEGKVCFWSRSRRCLWLKGETSGNYQIVREILFDCDGDALLIKVDQKGGACHTGYRSCFFRRVGEDGGFRIVGEKVFDPDKVYA